MELLELKGNVFYNALLEKLGGEDTLVNRAICVLAMEAYLDVLGMEE